MDRMIAKPDVWTGGAAMICFGAAVYAREGGILPWKSSAWNCPRIAYSGMQERYPAEIYIRK